MDFARIKGLILDMDGVLWLGSQPLLDMQAFFSTMKDRGMKVVLATNNATKSVSQYQEKLQGYGVPLPAEQIVNSAMSAAYYLKQKHPHGGRVFVVGEEGLAETMRDWGFQPAEEHVVAVVAGLDRTLTYAKLARAVRLIRDGVEFVGTNPDLTYPSPEGLTPGAGSVLAFIEAGSGVKPVITGKPQPFMFNLALQRMGLAPEEVLAVGDRLDTDILGGQRAGCRTAVVLSGVATQQEVDAWFPAPDLVIDNLSDLVSMIQV
ncbi:MAG TPA: HAD-IIA family hydrolase [Anaerolinea sp.]|nr:HAD-IIA family hydrolase [Anaerolinea sp.]